MGGGLRGTSARDGRRGLKPRRCGLGTTVARNETQNSQAQAHHPEGCFQCNMTCCGGSGGNDPGSRDAWGQKPGRLGGREEELRAQWQDRRPNPPTSRQTHLA